MHIIFILPTNYKHMANWVGVYKMKATEGNGQKIADLLAQMTNLKIP